MARKNKLDKDERFLDEDEMSSILDENLQIHEYEDEEEADEAELLTPKKKKPKKTLKEKLRYKGRYELLPERENWKQIRFYQRLFVLRYAALIGGIIAMLFAYATIRFNALFSVVVIFSVLPGIFWGILGLLKIRGWRFFLTATGVVINIVAIIMIIGPFVQVVGFFGQIGQLLTEYFTTFGI